MIYKCNYLANNVINFRSAYNNNSRQPLPQLLRRPNSNTINSWPSQSRHLVPDRTPAPGRTPRSDRIRTTPTTTALSGHNTTNSSTILSATILWHTAVMLLTSC